MNLLVYPDILTIVLLTVFLFVAAFVIKQPITTVKSFIITLLVATTLAISSLVLSFKNFCGSEICFYQGWPHYLYISLHSPSYVAASVFTSPLYLISNIVFYFALMIFVVSMYKRFIIVTPFSKYHLLVLFILFALVGVYLGMRYQQTRSLPIKAQPTVIIRPTSTSSIDTTAWKTYTDSSGKFSFQYPPSWKVTMMHIGDQSDKKDIRLTGEEGKIDIMWVRTYGGACPPAYQKLQLKNEIVNVCHTISSDIESWTQISKQFSLPQDPGLGVAIEAQANAPYTVNRDTLLQIFSTIGFSNNS